MILLLVILLQGLVRRLNNHLIFLHYLAVNAIIHIKYFARNLNVKCTLLILTAVMTYEGN